MSPRLHRTELGPEPGSELGPELNSDGPPVVFLHGLFGQGRNWTSIGKNLADCHRVLLLDLPDHGRSEWSEQVGYAAMADAVADALTEVEPGQRWQLVGHSMGGKVAMRLALSRPELVERLCVVDMAPVDYQGLTSFGRYVAAMRSVDLAALQHRSEADEALAAQVGDPVVRGFLLQNLRRETTADGVAWRWQMNLRLLGDRLDILSGWPDWDGEPYPGPVLWVAGAESDYIRPADAPAMRALFPAVRSVTIKQAGHWVHSEQPEVFTSVLRRFLEA